MEEQPSGFSEPTRGRAGFCARSRDSRGRNVSPEGWGEFAVGSRRKRPLQQLVTGIWNVSSADSSTVIIDLQGEVQYEAHRLSDPERIYFDLHGTSLAHGLFGKTIEVGDPMLARVRIAQPRKGVSRIVLETNGASDFSVSLQSNPYRLVVEIRKAAKAENSTISAVPNLGFQNIGSRDTDSQNKDSQNKAFQNQDFQNKDFQNKDFPDKDLIATITPQSALVPVVPGRAGGNSERPLLSPDAQVSPGSRRRDTAAGTWARWDAKA